MTVSETANKLSPIPSTSGIRASTRKTLALAALSGLLLVGAFPHLDQGWLAWIALVPFLCTFPHRRLGGALAAGAVLGLVFFGGMCYWIVVFTGRVIGLPLGLVAWLGAILAQTGAIIVFAGGAQWLRARSSAWAWRLGVPALWTLLEWARQFGALGTGWGDLAYTQHRSLLILQVTKLAGVWGLSFLIVLVNVAIAEWRDTHLPAALGSSRNGRIKKISPLLILPFREDPAKPRSGKQRGGFFGGLGSGGLLAAALLLAALLYGAYTLRTENLKPTYVAAALQSDIDPAVPWLGQRPEDPAYVRRVMETYGAQGRAGAARGAKLVVWPETSFPGYLRTDSELLSEISNQATRSGQAVLVGSRETDLVQNKDANSLFAISAQGQITGAYQKRRLVPFGEYVPYRKWLPFLDALHVSIFDMEAGPERQPLLDAAPVVGKIGAGICYDSGYGSLMREQAARGAGLFVIITDDTWFGRTAAARQHTAFSAIRAAESDRYLVRCAATGVSQVIAPTGQVLAEADLFRPGVVAAPVESRHTLTPYARWGDWFVGLCAALLVGSVLSNGRVRSVPGD